jgi:hypothetical protein
MASFLSSSPVMAQWGQADPLEQVSGTSMFADCTADLWQFQVGTVYHDSEVEPWVAVNPVDPLNVVATWQQDRWSNGGARGLGVGVSFDGGVTWETAAVPNLSRCSGAETYHRASDPWVSFGPDGSLYHIALSINPGNAVLVSKSTDGGLTWSGPVELSLGSARFFHDKESITADPTDADYVYAAWVRFDFLYGRGPAVYTRSSDGGLTWDPVRLLHDPGRNAQTQGNQIVVQPDGTLFDFFNEIHRYPVGPIFLAFKRSFDKGETWRPHSTARRALQTYPLRAVTPDTRAMVRDAGFLLDVAVDPRNGHLYLVWQDGRFSGFQYSRVAFSMSTDSGLHWSPPLAVNAAPDDVTGLNRQAFLPSVHVTENGMIGVSYYDFRFNDDAPGELTDHWLTWCHPDAADCSQPGRWRDEMRMTDESFDYLQAPFANGLFIGDYVGLAAAGDDFLAVFTFPHETDPSSAFSRRVVIPPTVDPGSNGYWKHQVTAHLTGRGRPHRTTQDLLQYLDDVKYLYDLFDDVVGLEGMDSVLDPETPTEMRTRLEQHVMALLLNLTSGRLSPYAEVEGGQTVKDAVDATVAVAEDAAADRLALEAAKDLAERLNRGDLSVSPAEDLMMAMDSLHPAPDLERSPPRGALRGLSGNEPLTSSPGEDLRPDAVLGDLRPAMTSHDEWGLVPVDIQSSGIAPRRQALDGADVLEPSSVLPELVYRAGVTATRREEHGPFLLLW